MVLLQHKLSVKLSQRQILTPGLVQMVSVLALNKLELKDMINAEMVENPVLEELEDSVPLLDEVGKKEEDRERAAAASNEENPLSAVEKKDPFEEIDFGSFFQDYLDPGYRTHSEMEDIERPSFENFLSKPTNLTDHLAWQLGALSLRREVREAADLIIGNLNEDGYLIASDDELLGVAPAASPETDAATAKNIVNEAQALGLADVEVTAAADTSYGTLIAPGLVAPFHSHYFNFRLDLDIDGVANDFFRARRYIGSGDRRAVSDRGWRVLRARRRRRRRCCSSAAGTPRCRSARSRR